MPQHMYACVSIDLAIHGLNFGKFEPNHSNLLNRWLCQHHPAHLLLKELGGKFRNIQYLGILTVVGTSCPNAIAGELQRCPSMLASHILYNFLIILALGSTLSRSGKRCSISKGFLEFEKVLLFLSLIYINISNEHVSGHIN